MTQHKHQLPVGTYTVFAAPEECKEAFERAKELGIRIYDYCDNLETELCYTEHDGVNCITAYRRGSCKYFQVITNKIPPAEFLARMENKLDEYYDNMVSEWHSGNFDKSLHEYLGMTIEQYGQWLNGKQSAENAQSTQPIEKLEQLPISEVKWQLEKERWKFDGLGNYADHSSNMFPIQLYRGRWCIKATIEEEYFKNALSDIQQAIDACQRLNNAKPE